MKFTWSIRSVLGFLSLLISGAVLGAVPVATLTGPDAGNRTSLTIYFSEALDPTTLAIDNVNGLLSSAINDFGGGGQAAIDVTSTTPGTVVWDITNPAVPFATVTIPSTAFLAGQTVRINFQDLVVQDLATMTGIPAATNVDATVSILTANFETTSNYSTSTAFALGGPPATDFWGRFAYTDEGTGHDVIGAAFSPANGIQGTYYFAGRDLNAGGADPELITLSSIDVSDYDNIQVKAIFAHKTSSNFDTNDDIFIEYEFDLGGFNSDDRLEGVNGSTNLTQQPSGITVGNSGNFTEGTFDIPDNGRDLVVRFRLEDFDNDNQEIFIDNVRLVGTLDNTAPTITGAVIASDNSYVDVTFSEGVYASDGTSALQSDGSDFAISGFMNMGGPGTVPSITGATQTDGSALAGGETVIRVALSGGGVPSGVEQFDIGAASNSIYDLSGNTPTNNPVTSTQTVTLNKYTISKVDFEGAPSSNYTINTGTPTVDDYWGQFAASMEGTDHNLVSPVTGTQGLNYFAGRDLNSNGAAMMSPTDSGVLVTNPAVTVTNYDNLSVSWLVSDGGTTENFEAGDILAIFYRFGGAGDFVLFGQFAEDAGDDLSVDTDFDEVGQGTMKLDDNLQDFSYMIPKLGTSLEIRVSAWIDGAAEVVVFDDIRVQGTIDNTNPTALEPTPTDQTLAGGQTSTSTVGSDEFGNVYLILNGEAASTQGEINTAVTANKGFLGKMDAQPNVGYTVTPGASLVSGVYDIVAVDAAGNVSAILPGWLTVDNDPPAFSSVTDGGDGNYMDGEFITFFVDLGETGLTVTGNYTVLDSDLGASEALLDDGNAPDVSASDGIYSGTISAVLDAGGNMLEGPAIAVTFTATDGAGNMATDNSLTLLLDKTDPVFGTIDDAGGDNNYMPGETVTFTVDMGETGLTVTGDYTTLDSDLGSAEALLDDGNPPDVTLNDGIYTGTTSAALGATMLANMAEGTGIAVQFTATDVAGNSVMDNSFTLDLDKTLPTVSSIVRTDANPTNASSVDFTVTFSEPVQAGTVNTGDFTLDVSGVAGAIISGVSGSGDTYTVTVDSYTSDGGTLSLDVIGASASISDVAGNVLTADKTDGEAYTIDNVAPTVLSITRVDPDFTNATDLDFLVTFSESVSGLDADGADFTVNLTGTAMGSLNTGSVTPAGPTDMYTVNVDMVSGTGTVRLDAGTAGSIVDALGNAFGTAFTTGEFYTVDDTPPTVVSITRDSPPNPSIPGVDVNFTVTFDDPVTGVAINNFTPSGTVGGTSISAVTPVSGPPSTDWTVTVTGIGTTGTVHIDLDMNESNVLNTVSLALADGTPTGAHEDFTIVNGPPDEDAVNFMATAFNTTTVDLTWDDPPGAGSQDPEFYLIVGVKNEGTPFVPTDNMVYSDIDNPMEDSVFLNVPFIANSAAQAEMFTMLRSGESYTFRIFPYTNAGTPKYKADGPQPNVVNMPVGGITTVVAGTLADATISSLVDTQGETTGSINLEFDVRDDNLQALPAGDNIPTLISQIEINRDLTFDNINNWTFALGVNNAELTDGSTTIAGTVTADKITFSGIPTGPGLLGEVPDNSTKTYQLKIWLKSTLTGGLADLIDGRDFVFQVTPGTGDFVTTGNTSLIQAGAPVNSQNGRNVVSVVTDNFLWTTQPDDPIGVNVDMSTPPVVRAQDANGNRDLSYNNTIITAGLPMAGQTLLSNSGGIAMTGVPASFSSGILTFPANFRYQNSGDGTLALDDGSVMGSSNSVTVSFGDNTTISPGTFGPIASINTTLAGGYVRVFDFILTDDDAGVTVDDGVATQLSQVIITVGGGNDVTNWKDAIEEAVLSNDVTDEFLIVDNSAITSNTITFSSIETLATGALGLIPDNGSKNFNLYLMLKTTMTGAQPDQIDNDNFVFNVNTNDITPIAISSKMASGQSENSGATNIEVEVDATTYFYDTEPSTTAFVDTDLAQQPVVRAGDVYGNVDEDYNQAASVTTTPVAIPFSGAPSNFSSGFLTFATFQFDNAGTVSLVVSDADASPNASVTSQDPIVISFSATSDLIKDPAFTYPTNPNENIDYTAFQTVGGNVTVGTSIELERFLLRDGGASAPDADGAPTVLSDLDLSIANGANLDRIALYDDTNTEIPGTDLPVTPSGGDGTVSFSGLSITAPDGFPYTEEIRVRATFKAPVIDRQVISFTVTGVSTTGITSTFLDPLAGGGATSTVSGDDNKIQVTATQLDFTIQPAATSINTPFSTPPQVSARDVLMSVDRDYTDPVGALDVDDGGTSLAFDADNMSGGANDALTGNYVLGVFDFPANFVMTEAGDGMDIVMTLPDDGGVSPTDAVSSMFDIIASEESQVVIDPTFTFADSLLYINHQAGNIMGDDGMDTVLARFLVVDGDGITPDIDGAGTELTEITFDITNSINLRQIALYDGSNNEIGTEQVAGPTVTFSGLSVVAPDGGTAPFSVRASFQTAVTDNDTIQLEVTSIMDGAGSKFAPLFNVAANSGFQNDFDPVNWTPTIQNTDGSVNTTGVPNSITLFGGNDGIAPGTELITNGNFETGSLVPFAVPSGNWFNVGPIGGPFATVSPISGARQAYTYFYIGGVHQMYQQVTIPAGATATLQWYDWIQWDEPTLFNPSRNYNVTVRNTSNGVLQTLYTLNTPIGPSSGSTGWQFHSLNLSAYAGQTVRIFFEANVPVSSGFGLLTVDLVTLQVSDINAGNTDYVRLNVPSDGTITFDWNYSTSDSRGLPAQYDPAYYLLNGGQNALSNPVGPSVQSGMGTVPVSTNDDFGFRVRTTDGHSGQANMTISNFVFTPGTGFPAPETPDNKNLINVVATSLDFTTLPDDGKPFDPEVYLGVDSTFATQPVIEARDANANLDINFSKIAAISTSGLGFVGAPPAFVNGILDFATTGNFRYTATGNGTFDIDANLLNVQSPRIEVIQTNVSQVTRGVAGKPGVPALQGDTVLGATAVNKTILGFELNTLKSFPDDDVDQPLVDEVRIDFSNNIYGVFRNIRLYRSSDDTIAFAGPSQDELIATATNPSGPTTSITFTGLSSAADLEMDNNVTNQRFFVVVNVAPSVWTGTPAVTPYLNNFAFDPGLKMTTGGVFGNVTGYQYSFRDNKEPQIVSLQPPDGAINVNPTLDFILEFDEPVIPLDSMIDVYKIEGFNEIFIATLRLDDPGSGASADSTTFTFANPGNILGNDTVYFVRLAPGDTAVAQRTGFVDRTGNGFPGFETFADWSFRTSDKTPPIFLGPDSVQALNIMDLGFELKARIDEPGEIFFIVVDNNDPVPDSAEIKDPALYMTNYPAATVHFSDTINASLGTKYYYASVLGLSAGTDYDVYFTAQDEAQPDPNLMLDNQTVKLNVMTLGSVPAGVLIFTDDLDICIGDFQEIRTLSLVEGAAGDFGTGNGQTFNLLLPEGFVFNTSKGSVVAAVLSGTADVDPLTITRSYVNNTTLRLTYDVNAGSNGRDIIRVSNLEINATGPIESSFTGDILRLGGTAVQNNNAESDMRSHGLLTTVGTGEPVFNSDPPFTSAIPDNIGKVALRVPLGTEDYEFTGPGVFMDTLFVSVVGVGDHDVTLTVTDEFGCVSSRTETFQIIDNESAIAGLDATYCVDDSPDLILSTEKPNNTLLSLDFIKTNRFTGDTLDANPPGLMSVGSDYLFEPAVADSGRFIFQASYFNSDNGQTEVFNQVVFLFVPPTINGFVIEQPTRPVFNGASSHFCRDDGDLTVTPVIDFADGDGQTDVFTYIIDDGTGTNADPVADLGFTVDNSGVLSMNMDDLATFFGLSNMNDQIPITIELTYEDLNVCMDVRDTIIMLNEIPDITFSVDDVGPVGTILNPEYCIDAIPVQITGLDDSVAVSAGIFDGDGIFDNGNGTARFTPRLAAEITGTETTPNFGHSVDFIYTDSVTGCFNSITRTLVVQPLPVVDVVTSIAGTGALFDTYCIDAAPLLIQGTATSAAGRDTSVFFLNGLAALVTPQGLTDNGNETSLFDPAAAMLASGTSTRTPYQIVMRFTDQNQCRRSDTVNIAVQPLPNADYEVRINGEIDLNRQFCVNDAALIELEGLRDLPTAGSLTAISEFKGTLGGGKAVDDGGIAVRTAQYFPTEFRFDALTSQSVDTVVYEYTDEYGCFNSSTQAFILDPLPLPSFIIDSVCSKEVVSFLADPTVAPTDSPDRYIWNFGELGGKDTVFTSSEAMNEFDDAGLFNVSLQVETVNGCLSDSVFTSPILVGSIPEPRIRWENVCAGNQTFFNGTPRPNGLPLNIQQMLNEVVEEYTWDFGDGTIVSSDTNIISHQFPGAGDYVITLGLVTNTTCDTMITRTVSILPTITPTATDEYFADFSTTGAEWRAESEDPMVLDSILVSNTTWALGTINQPNVAQDPSPNNVAWVTNPIGDYEAEENSWVNSPCFNITQLERPVLSLDTWIDTDPADGAIVQYSTDGGRDWRVLRISDDSEAHESGINWFNTDGINAVPGEINNDARYGWSLPSTGWRTSKHRLDEIPVTGQDEVRFRMAFASVFRDFNVDKVGFAFDNVFVGDRDRTVLLEQFTNGTLAENQTANNGIKTLLDTFGEDLISISYHTDFPEPDAFNLANPLDPSGRRAYYNVPLTPYSFIDGGYDPGESAYGGNSLSNNQLTFSPKDIRRRSLTDPMFDIAVNLPSSGPDKVTVDVNITALTDIDVRTRTQIAIVERVVTGVNTSNGETEFRNVLRKMLPDAGGVNNIGTANPDQFAAGESYQVPSQNWKIRNVLDPNQLAVVVFVQSDKVGETVQTAAGRFFARREVFQAAVRSITGKQVITATSEEELIEFLLSNILLYPNPADNQMSVLFNTVLKEEMLWKIFDMRGMLVGEGKVLPGVSEFSIDTQNYPSALYNLFIGNSNLDFQSKTFVIRH